MHTAQQNFKLMQNFSYDDVVHESRRWSAVAQLSELISPQSENREPALRRPAALRSNSGGNRRALTLKSTRPHCERLVARDGMLNCKKGAVCQSGLS